MDLSRYGPWALILGGSEGIGEHFARLLAAAGINVLLVARNPEPLAATAEVARAAGVEVRTLSLDVTAAGAFEQVVGLARDVELGLVIHNIGGGGGSGQFIEQPEEQLVGTILANNVLQLRLARRFAPAMVERGRGGLLFVGSMAGNVGGYHFAAYAAAKAYTQNLAEGLWAELEPLGVDVLALVIGATDTPSRRRSGVVDDGAMPVARPKDVARHGLEQLPHGPVFVTPENQAFFDTVNAMPRREAAVMMRDLLTRMTAG